MSSVSSIRLQTGSGQLVPLLLSEPSRAADMSSINRFEFLNRLLVHWSLEGITCPSVGYLHSSLCGNGEK